MITKEQIKEYIKAGGVRCPFCKSPDIKVGYIGAVGREAWQKCTCNKCGRRWLDIYELKTIEEAK